MMPLSTAIDYAPPAAQRPSLDAKLVLAVSFLPILAILFAFFDPFAGTGRGEPIAGLTCVGAFLTGPPNFVASVCCAFIHRKQPPALTVCFVAAVLSGFATAMVAFVVLMLFLHGFPC